MDPFGGILSGYLHLFNEMERTLFRDICPVAVKELLRLNKVFGDAKGDESELTSLCSLEQQCQQTTGRKSHHTGTNQIGEPFGAEKFEACEKNIEKILNLLKTADDARKEFLRVFPEWKKQRKANMEQLREVEKSLIKDKTYCNVGKIVASSIGVAGGAAVIGSLLFPPLVPAVLPAWLGGATVSAFLPSFLLPTTVAVTSPLAVGGGIAAGAGGVANITASVTEVALVKKHVDKAKEICEADKLNFKKLEKWFSHSEELANALDELVGLDVIDSVLKDLNDTLKLCVSVDLTDPSCYKESLKLFIRSLFDKIDLVNKYGFELAVVITAVLFIVFVINRRNHFVFRCAMQTRQLCLGLACFADAGVQIGRLIAAAGLQGTAAAELIPKALAQRIAVGALTGIGIGLDFANIVLSSVDLAKGSLGDEGKMIGQIINKLKEELDAFKDVYSNIVMILIDKYDENNDK